METVTGEPRKEGSPKNQTIFFLPGNKQVTKINCEDKPERALANVSAY